MHITKDISEIFKINQDEAEKIKRSFNKSDTEFSYKDDKNERNFTVNEILKKNISINKLKNSDLFFIGHGSILLNDNSFYLTDKFEFKTLNFYLEKDDQICSSILVHYVNNNELPKKINKKQGIFEKFFYFFSK